MASNICFRYYPILYQRGAVTHELYICTVDTALKNLRINKKQAYAIDKHESPNNSFHLAMQNDSPVNEIRGV